MQAPLLHQKAQGQLKIAWRAVGVWLRHPIPAVRHEPTSKKDIGPIVKFASTLNLIRGNRCCNKLTQLNKFPKQINNRKKLLFLLPMLVVDLPLALLRDPIIAEVQNVPYRMTSKNRTKCYVPVVENYLLQKRGESHGRKRVALPPARQKKNKKSTRPYQKRQLQRHSTQFHYLRSYDKWCRWMLSWRFARFRVDVNFAIGVLVCASKH